ncbi:hemagglutinin repeat-containing protein [Caballeronia sp. KNU42]
MSSKGGAGISVFANGFAASGHGNGESVTQENTTVAAGNALTIHSGRDTTLDGAQVSGNAVSVDVGRDLTMTSEKDTSNYAERQSSVSGGLSYTFGAGGFSGSASASRTKIDSNFDAVGQQTGIVAGEGGFDVNVAGHTQLNGAQIASSASADKNTFTTGSFSYSDIANSSESSGSTTGVTLGSGPAIGCPQFAQTSDNANGTTYAAISPATITVNADEATGIDSTAGLSRDTTNANQTVQNTFNLRETQNDLAFAQAFGKTATYAMAEAAGQLAKSNPEVFGEGKPGRDVMHAAVAAIGAAISGGNIAGAVGGSLTSDALTALAKPIIDQAVSGLPPGSQEAARNALNVVVATAGGAAAGSLAGGSQGALAGAGSASNNEIYNRQLHEDSKAKEQTLAKKLADESGGKYTPEQIKDQMAQMNLTVDGQTESGGVRVATGAQPQDGTQWQSYGVNKAGQQVWAQSLGPGDPDLQSYIVNGAQGSGLAYQATTTGSNPGLVRAPDFVNFQVDYFVGSAWGTFTRDGNSFFGTGVNMALPNPVQASASITAGWLNQTSVRPGQTNDFAGGYAGGMTGAYGVLGGGMMYSPGNGTATIMGVGGGVSAGKNTNIGGVGGGFARDQGKTGIGW